MSNYALVKTHKGNFVASLSRDENSDGPPIYEALIGPLTLAEAERAFKALVRQEKQIVEQLQKGEQK